MIDGRGWIWSVTYVMLDEVDIHVIDGRRGGVGYFSSGNILSHGLIKYYLLIYHVKRLIQIIFSIILGNI